MTMTDLHTGDSPFARRRRLLLDWMRSQGGGVAVLATAPERARNRDNQYAYRHDSDFYYLTGFSEPGAWLILVAGAQDRAILCCMGKQPEREIWDGVRWGPEAAATHFGFDEAHDSERLDDLLPGLLVGAERVFAVLSGAQGTDLAPRLQRWTAAAAGLSRGARALPVHWTDLSEIIAEMRLFKDVAELDTMRRAAAISARGHVRAMQAAYPGCHEYELEAELLYTFRKSGAQSVAYDSIVAAGANACVLHHRAGHAVARDGDLILIDAGCELDGYASDITRTFPVNGRFTGPQRALYDIVLEAQREAALRATPAFDFNAGHDAAVRILTQGMLDLGLIAGTLDNAIERGAYQRFYMHRTGHWLGMDVHDVGAYREAAAKIGQRPWRKLAPGMVLTIEPGIYVRPSEDVREEFWNIGIRIEDDAIVTDAGAELITRGVPVDPQAIEALMQEAAG